MSIVSTIFILSMTFPNEPKQHNPENNDIFNTALTVRTMNQSFAESPVSKTFSRLYLWEVAWHSDNDWWPATNKLGTFRKQGLLCASETVMQRHHRIDVSIW